jgi:hypothetical protein
MCSSARAGTPRPASTESADPAPADVATRLGQAIDELAAISADDASADGLAERLAGAWALVTQADADVAARAARYSR